MDHEKGASRIAADRSLTLAIRCLLWAVPAPPM